MPKPDDGVPLPDVPLLFVSRNRLPTLDGHSVGAPLDITGRESTLGGRLIAWYPDGRLVNVIAGTGL